MDLLCDDLFLFLFTDDITKDIEIYKKYGNNALVVNLMNAMKIAKDNILTAESQLAEVSYLKNNRKIWKLSLII